MLSCFMANGRLNEVIRELGIRFSIAVCHTVTGQLYLVGESLDLRERLESDPLLAPVE